MNNSSRRYALNRLEYTGTSLTPLLVHEREDDRSIGYLGSERIGKIGRKEYILRK